MEGEPIFGPYWDGQHNVYADPLKVRRILKARLEGKPDVWIDRTKSPDPSEKSIAIEKISLAARDAFGMMPFSKLTGKGATETDCLRAVQLFLDWQTAKKDNTRPSPICSPPMGPGEFQLPMMNTLACISTSTDKVAVG